MLTITYKGVVREYTVHQFKDIDVHNIDSIEEVAAGGVERVQIRKCMSEHLPDHYGEVTRWFGDMAKFIVGNITLMREPEYD